MPAPGQKLWKAAVETVAVPLGLADAHRLRRRAQERGAKRPADSALGKAYLDGERRWVIAAADTGLWTASQRHEPVNLHPSVRDDLVAPIRRLADARGYRVETYVRLGPREASVGATCTTPTLADDLLPALDAPAGLSYEEMINGVPCPTCGRPLIRQTAAPVTGAERKRERAWLEFHRDQRGCGAPGWTMQGENNPAHCLRCCPPAPLSDKQLRRIARILFGSDG